MPITRASHPDLLWPGVMSLFGLKYNEYSPEFSQIFDPRTSKKASEKIVEVSGFGLAPQKAEGQAIQYDTDSQGFVQNFTHITYGLGWQATREEIEDGQYVEVSSRRTRSLARSMRVTKEIVHANILNRAFSGSYLGADGKALLATDHPTLAANLQNRPTVDADLTEASVEDMLTLIAAATDRRGLPIRLRGMKLVVASGAQFNAHRVLNSSLRSGTANNDTNAVKDMGLLDGGISVNHYLTDPDAWFIKTDADEGLVSIQRREVEFDKDNDFDTENAKAKATERYSCGWGDPRGLFGTQGA